MRTLRFAPMALGLALAGGLFAADAAAQTTVQASRLLRIQEIAKVESIGGFTIQNDTVRFLAQIQSSRLTAGYVLVERKVRTQHGLESIHMSGRLTAQEMWDVWMGAFLARPWSAREVRPHFVNVDFPSTRITYAGAFTQLVNAGFASPQDAAHFPLISPEMERFIQLAWSHVATVADSPLFFYEARGGRQGFDRYIKITQSGDIEDNTNYHSSAFSHLVYQRFGRITPQEVNALKGAIDLARWWQLQDFPGNPSYVDGIDIWGTAYRLGQKHTVFAGFDSNRPRNFQAILNQVEGFASQLTP